MAKMMLNEDACVGSFCNYFVRNRHGTASGTALNGRSQMHVEDVNGARFERWSPEELRCIPPQLVPGITDE